MVLPSNITTKYIENHAETLGNLYNAVYTLRDAFDLIVADMAPSIDDIHSAFFYASDYIIIPTINSAYSIDAIGDTLDAMDEHNVQGVEYGLQCGQVLGVLPTAFEAATSIKRRLRAKLYKEYKGRAPIFPEMRKLDIWEAAAASRQSIWTLTSNNPFEMEAIERARTDMMPIIHALAAAMEKAA
jgi:cellulose biosynthesis protein BcsQ